jgi:predicted Ser/Thr protein kinase
MDFEKIGKYTILGEIGQGAMGVVYKAQDPILNRFVAIKMISANLGGDDDLRKRFHREAQAAARLNHPNIITVFDFGEEQGRIYMAMELLEGLDLKDMMASGTLQTLDDKLAVMEQILDGLAYAHSKDVVHRDLKPGNIHIQPNGQIKILDFGLARLGSSEMTQAGVVMGTPNYMSPEQVLGEKVDARSDIFAMGAVFYEVLTSHKPFEAESMHGVLFQVVHKEPTEIRKWAPDLPPVLVQIVEKCLVKDKTRRFPNAGELREALGMARQALAAGRIQEATLDMESGKVFLDSEFVEDADGTVRPASGQWASSGDQGGQWVEGTVALDKLPVEGRPAPGAQTLSGRARTQAGRAPGQSLPPMAPSSSRLPRMIVGAVVFVGLLIAGIILIKNKPVTTTTGVTQTGIDPVLELLIQTRNELAARDLADKNYKKAIDGAETTLNLLKSKNAPADFEPAKQAQQILKDARAKLTEIESAATEADDAFKGGDMEKALAALSKLMELDPKHPVATSLSGQLNKFFKTRAEDAKSAMVKSRGDADSSQAASNDDYQKAMGLAKDANDALGRSEYAVATKGFLEARDAFDRARRAVEAAAAQQQREAAKAAAEKAAADKAAADRAAAEKAAADKAAADRVAAEKAAADRAAAERAAADKAAAEKAPTTKGVVPVPVAPSLAPPKPPVGRLVANAANLTDVSSAEMEKKGLSGAGSPEFTGTLELDVSPERIAPGDTFKVKIFVTNTGKKTMKIRNLAATTRINRAPGPPLTANLTQRDVEVGQKVQIGETSGTWDEKTETWILEVKIRNDKGDSCSNKVVFRKGQ